MSLSKAPLKGIIDSELENGLKKLKIDGVLSQLMGTFIGNAFIVPLMLLLGASSFHIGMYSAIVALSTVSQLLSIRLINRTKSRKVISVISSLFARISLLAIPFILLFSFSDRLIIFFVLLSSFYFISNISSGAFKHWMLDFVPKKIRGDYFANRTRDAIIVSSLAGIAMAYYIDYVAGEKLQVYSLIVFMAAVSGLFGVYFLSKIPEPRLKEVPTLTFSSLKNVMNSPDLNRHFRVIFFVYLALNISLPYFVYYMIKYLDFNTFYIFAFTLLGQFATIISLPKWGKLIDKYGVKPILKLSVRLMALILLLWPFTTLPNKYFLSPFIVALIYILTGIISGGLNLSSSLISYSLVRDSKKNAAIALNDVFMGLGALSGSVIGAILSIPASYMELSLTFNIYYPNLIQIYFIDLQGIDFLFVLSSLLILSVFPMFSKYRVENEIDEEKNYYELVVGLRRYMKNFRNEIFTVVNDKVWKNNSFKKIKLKRKINNPHHTSSEVVHV